MPSYDDWKCGAHPSPAEEQFSEQAENFERDMDTVISASVALVNQKNVGQFEVQPMLVDWPADLDGPLYLELAMRLTQVPTDIKSAKGTADEVACHLESLAKQIRECSR